MGILVRFFVLDSLGFGFLRSWVCLRWDVGGLEIGFQALGIL